MNASIGKRDPDKQGHRTPPEFLHAVERRFGSIGFDLAATTGHEVTRYMDSRGRWIVGRHFNPEMDSLKQDWSKPLVLPEENRPVVWLNPPHKDIRPWAAKLDAECRYLQRWTLSLVPASMGSKWWERHVLNRCFALGVTRMTFVGSKNVFPKDLSLLCYGYGVAGHGFWDWREPWTAAGLGA